MFPELFDIVWYLIHLVISAGTARMAASLSQLGMLPFDTARRMTRSPMDSGMFPHGLSRPVLKIPCDIFTNFSCMPTWKQTNALQDTRTYLISVVRIRENAFCRMISAG